MSRSRPVGPLGLLRLLLVLLLGFSLWQAVTGFRLETDITRFLPAGEERERLVLSRLTRSSGLAQSMILDLAVPEGREDEAIALADRLVADLRASGLFLMVRAAVEPGFGEEVYRAFFPRRLALISDDPEAEIPERFGEEGLARALIQLKEQLRLPSGMMIKQVATADPLLLFPARMKALEAQGRKLSAPLHRQHFFSADHRHLLVMARTKAEPMDSMAQREVLDLIEARFAARNVEAGGGFALTYTGFNRFAVASEARIKADITWATTVSAIGVVLIFLLFYRRLRFLPLVLAPLGFGMAAAIGVTLAVYGSLHGLTMGFGSTLLGITIDFPVHLLNHLRLSREEEPEVARANWRRLHWSLGLGMGTTLLGFVVLFVSEYPGVRQIALFSSTGVLAAFLFSVAFLPLFRRWVRDDVERPASRFGQQLRALAAVVRRRRVAVLSAVALLAAAAAPTVGLLSLETDLRNLYLNDPQMVAEDAAIRAHLPGAGFSLLLFVSGDTQEEALRHNDALFAQLGELEAAGRVAAFNSVHPLLPSQALQRRNLKALQGIPDLEARVREALAAAGFRPESFGDFYAALAEVAAGEAPVLTPAVLSETRLTEWTENFIFAREGRHYVMTMVKPASPADLLEDVLPPAVTSFSEIGLANTMVDAFQRDSVVLILAGLIVVALALLLYHRRLRPALGSFLPAVVAGWLTLAVIALLGDRINFLHVMSFLLVLCMGVDYGIFVADSLKSRGETELPVATRSVLLSALTTFFAFGVLGLCNNPALQAVGRTVGIGIIFACVLAVVLNLALSNEVSDA